MPCSQGRNEQLDEGTSRAAKRAPSDVTESGNEQLDKGTSRVTRVLLDPAARRRRQRDARRGRQRATQRRQQRAVARRERLPT